MSLQRNDPAAAVRRTTLRALAVDAIASLAVFAIVSHVLGMILFVLGVVATGGYWYNFKQVMKTRGYR